MDKSNVFVSDNLNLINQAESRQVVTQHFLGHRLIQSSEIDVSGCIALGNAKHHLRRNWTSLAPTDLEFLVVKRKFFDCRISMESGSGSSIQERDEHAGLLGKDTNRFQRAKMNQVEKFINRCVSRKVADVYGSSGLVVSSGSRCSCCSRGGGRIVTKVTLKRSLVLLHVKTLEMKRTVVLIFKPPGILEACCWPKLPT
jgi:hypothetical protein